MRRLDSVTVFIHETWNPLGRPYLRADVSHLDGVAVLHRPGSAGPTAPGFLVLAAYSAGKTIQFAFPAAWVFLFDRTRFRLQRPHFAGLGNGLAFGLATTALLLSSTLAFSAAARPWPIRLPG